MRGLNVSEYLFIFSLFSIWSLLLINIVLAMGGYLFYFRNFDKKIKKIDRYPMVSILVPAHNEAKVIGRTVESLLLLNYPKDKMELIVINDNSSDNSREILESIKNKYKNYNFTIINTDSITGGKGKSNALNIGYKISKGEFIAVYDADNTPDRDALRYLIQTIVLDDELGAVIGKFRTRNKSKNLLTKFINIETLSFQWMSQAGRWQLFNLCTIPGTNFILRKSIIEEIGGWDSKAIAEDTEISFRIYKLGYKIKLVPQSITWEQEPETIKVWIKQRTRWAKGNIYVLMKYIKNIFKQGKNKIVFDIAYFFSVYFLFLTSVIISDILFVLSVFKLIEISIPINFIIIWILSYILFIIEVSISLTIEKGEATIENIFIVALMYFTYSQLWLFVAIKGMVEYLKDIIFKREVKWYKTERF
ncbi:MULTISPECIES: glycosyltransferase [unclassified Clostridioides]|uniref:glycosyltransferase n=1 Tax=unclassified Clostridioides TaxID=2635829 RepID=UPI001D120934|nr:glycosyltransferase family 2 protein [Clostridioides sp. ZZV14-6150]MCC0662242.1 glycosyltransferase family 2 protein [Clostridioides sp. ZZV14-6154]MCC0670032.1 glycosyltransferase family 2 protein [Clostridioides sp. ZZV14-6153]MCC0720150.1 glycosyltransferase family 2 protein [Clostridioides sp. ZZV14-6105]MCC0724241.1 glycosyltransferase family 2 protein [Clostridioides sp. ZZV14-6104]MCC0728026.1 glycosyltransferase family 2 protein [Clostridioides sp. ZZV14-6045]MCC0732478.1 glycosyl